VPELPLLNELALERLRRLRAPGDPDLVAELARLFVGEARARFEALEGADPEACRLAAHSLRGSAGQLGATRLAAACAALEADPGPEMLEAALRELEAVHPLLRALAEQERD
jgi:HPt (histidine-containing phosphotransfer) domain-containing protein